MNLPALPGAAQNCTGRAQEGAHLVDDAGAGIRQCRCTGDTWTNKNEGESVRRIGHGIYLKLMFVAVSTESGLICPEIAISGILFSREADFPPSVPTRFTYSLDVTAMS